MCSEKPEIVSLRIIKTLGKNFLTRSLDFGSKPKSVGFVVEILNGVGFFL